MSLSKEECKHIANLGRLSLTESEIEQYAQDLNQILDYVTLLQELDTTNVEPMIGAIELQNVNRPDETQPSSPEQRANMLSNAPDSEAVFIKVPKMTSAGS